MVVVICASSVGCRHRAYSDLYVENMASEIRDLEDQLYEYDYQYKLLEQELDSLRAQHYRMSPKPAPELGLDPQPLEFQGPDAFVPAPLGDADPAEEIDAPPAAGPSILDGSPGSSPTTPSQPAGGTEAGSSGSPSVNPPDITLPDAPAGSSEGSLPPLNYPNGSGGARNPFPADDNSASSADEFELTPEELAPPSIEPGVPMPPPTVFRGDRVDNQGVENALERNLSRIEVPTQLASSQTRDREPASLSPVREQTQDQRVVEMAFHSSLTRAANFDEDPDDDGLILVLQPLNTAGEMVPVAADLFVGVLDPSRPEGDQWISRRKYTAGEVQAKIKPIGAQQGIHLTLPWIGPDPEADRVVVFVYYTFPDDRTVVGEKTIFVNNKHGTKTVWAPRSIENPGEASAVRAAAYEQLETSERVVRPAAASSSQPAPEPR